MLLQIDKLGKVAITIEQGYWNNGKDYDKLTVVEKEGTFGTFISRKPVPAGTPLTNRTYWIPFSSLKEEIVLAYEEWVNRYGGIVSNEAIVINQLQKIINDIYSHLPQGIFVEGDIDCIEHGITDVLNLHVGTTNEKEAKFFVYVNDVLFGSYNIVEETIDIPVNGDTAVRVECVQNEFSYIGNWNVIDVYPTYIGCSNEYTNILNNGSYKIPVTTNIDGEYTLNVETEGDFIFICVPKSTIVDKVTMNGFDVPMEDEVIVTDEHNIEYKIFKSSNGYTIGEYEIFIGEYKGDDKDTIESILERLDTLYSKFDNITKADEEDITEVSENDTKVFKLADKEYNAESFSGLGRVNLRKNIVDGHNYLTQEMISKANTIYKIQYDYEIAPVTNSSVVRLDQSAVIATFTYNYAIVEANVGDTITINPSLGDAVVYMENGVWTASDIDAHTPSIVVTESMINVGVGSRTKGLQEVINYTKTTKSITIPGNCVLEFEGGSLSGGTLIGNGTCLIASKGSVFNNTSLLGTFKNTVFESKWFMSVDDFIKSINASTGYEIIKFEKKIYMPSIGIILNNNRFIEIDGAGADIIWNRVASFITINNTPYADYVTDITLTNNPNKGDRQIQVVDGSSIKTGDVIILRDTRANSFSPYRSYNNGEYIFVENVVGNSVFVANPLFASYDLSALESGIVKNYTNINIHDFSLKSTDLGDLTSSSTVRAIYVNHSYGNIHNISVSCKTHMQLAIMYSYNINISGCKVTGKARNNQSETVYGIFVGNSQFICTENNIIIGGQHGLAHGGIFSGNSYFGIPCRNIYVIKNNICSQQDIDTFNTYSLDFHGCCEYITIKDNYVGSIDTSAPNTLIINNEVVGTRGIFVGSEIINIGCSIIGNRIKHGITISKSENYNIQPQYYIPDEDSIIVRNNIIKEKISIQITKNYWNNSNLSIKISENKFHEIGTGGGCRIAANIDNVVVESNRILDFTIAFALKSLIFRNNEVILNSQSRLIRLGYFASTHSEYFDLENVLVENNYFFNAINNGSIIHITNVTVNNLVVSKNTFKYSSAVTGYSLIMSGERQGTCDALAFYKNTIDSVKKTYYCFDMNVTKISFDGNVENFKTIVSEGIRTYNTPIIVLKDSNSFNVGTFANKPTLTSESKGYSYFATDLGDDGAGAAIFYTGSKWVESDGTTVGVQRAGLITKRPALADINAGFMYLVTQPWEDDTLGTDGPAGPYYFDGSNSWILADGTTKQDGQMPARS